ncbi:MAG TPA: hypothetical protein ENH26_01130 [Candidatus Wolfebacteria bacterium]|nr:hypothetical protein [Candidatus Wolfebacteria bacterium]
MSFSLQDFNALLSTDKNKIGKVDDKLKNLIKKISKKLDYPFGFYNYNGRYSGYISKSNNKKTFFNFQINSEDLSVEFLIVDKNLILKFINNVNLKILRSMKKLGDTEIAIWDKRRKVCKLYPEYLDNKTWKFLYAKVGSVNSPIFKFRKIYSRGEAIFQTNKLEANIINSIKQIEIFLKYL